MKLVIGICTYNRNSSLSKCLKSINNLNKAPNIEIQVIVVDNTVKNYSFKLVKKIKKTFKFKLKQLQEKKRGIVCARNKFLSVVKKINPKFICFFDDDGIIDSSWLKNVIRLKKLTGAEVITGPQLAMKSKSSSVSNLTNYSQYFEKNYKSNITRVNWAASNNVFLEYDIVKKHKLVFDKVLNKFGIGEDQLFFSKLNSYGHKIYWGKNVKVYEHIYKHRTDLNWLIRRSYRLGVLGHYLDISLYGRLIGFINNYLKCIYYFVKAFGCIFLFFNSKFKVQILNYFSRFYGRLIGPFVLKKIDFFKK